MKKRPSSLVFVLALLAMISCSPVKITGELKTWHRLTLTFKGPETSESADPNPFTDYRLLVTFTNGSKTVAVPGYFAAGGNAAETGADSGDRWRVHFTPDTVGLWNYTVSFRQGPGIAFEKDPTVGTPMSFDGTQGRFAVTSTDKNGSDARARGALQFIGEHYLRFAETGDFFLKGGADSPENFLAYYEFNGGDSSLYSDSTRQGEAKKALEGGLHRYDPHRDDWTAGDPVWQGDKGKNIIGALNYLAGKGMNSVYFLTMNVGGDGKDVWPWISMDERYRFDCSKLDQWEIVFSHMDQLGLIQHVVLTETENEALFEVDEGLSTSTGFADSRKLYYRELIARFGHHPAMIFNVGEENGWENEDVPYGAANSDEQRKMFADYIHDLDPYDHPIVVHTLPGRYDEIYTPLLGYESYAGPSLQMGNPKRIHEETITWIARSAQAGHKWFVCLDEIGPAHTGVKPDADDYRHDEVRHYSLWGNLMAGGSGVEWYFGYRYPNNDLNCEDWRSRDHMWDLTRYALDFFHTHLPFWEMESTDALTVADDDYCFAKAGEVYAVYLPSGGTTSIDLAVGQYTIHWFNPRSGGDLEEGSMNNVEGPGLTAVGDPPGDNNKDWVVLIQKRN